MNGSFHVTIIGAGIVGMATAMHLLKAYPHLRIAVVEKEGHPGFHQTGHNSGVIHSGIYYKPGSLKALLCVSGVRKLIRFCQDEGVPYEQCGKVVIATEPDEISRLHDLYHRGIANDVSGLRLLDPIEVRDFEPHTVCLQGLLVPTTGIVDFGLVAQTYARIFLAAGGEVFFNSRVTAISEDARGIHLDTTSGHLSSRLLINCGGLYSDSLTRLSGIAPPCRIVPFRGEYYQIRPEKSHLVKNLIYPVPDPRFPFLGVHFTRMIDGKVEAGPNAVLAYAKEGYTKGRVSPQELSEVLRFKGFWHLAFRYWRPGLSEMIRSYSKTRFTLALQKLIPQIQKNDLLPGGAGVRAQALDKDGRLLDDFVILKHGRMLHVLNAPSPAATSSLAIAEHLVQTASPLLDGFRISSRRAS